MKLRRNLLELVASLLFVLPLGGHAQKSAEGVLPVRIGGIDLQFSPSTNRLSTANGVEIQEAKAYSHSNAIAFPVGPGVARFYTGSRDNDSIIKPDAAFTQKLAHHEIDSLIELSGHPIPLAVTIPEKGEVGDGILYADTQLPKSRHRVADLIKNGTYSEFHKHLQQLAHSLVEAGWDIGLKVGHAIIDLDGPEPKAKLMRAVYDDRKLDFRSSDKSKIKERERHLYELAEKAPQAPSQDTLRSAYDRRLARLQAWSKIHKELIAAEKVPDLKDADFAKTPEDVARLVVQAMRVRKPIWIWNNWPKGGNGKTRVPGKVKILPNAVPAEDSSEHDYLLDGYFRARIYTEKGDLGPEQLFRLEYTSWASVTEPEGSSPDVQRPLVATKARTSPVRMVSEKTLSKREEKIATQAKESYLKKGRRFEFSREGDPTEALNILQLAQNQNTEIRVYYEAAHKPTELAKKQAEPAREAGIGLNQFTGKVKTIIKKDNDSPEYLVTMVPTERIAQDKDGDPHYRPTTFNPWRGRVRIIEIVETKPFEPSDKSKKPKRK